MSFVKQIVQFEIGQLFLNEKQDLVFTQVFLVK